MPVTIDPTKLLEFGFNGVFVIVLIVVVYMLWNMQKFNQDMLKSAIETSQQIARDSAKTQAETVLTLQGICTQLRNGFLDAKEARTAEHERIIGEIRELRDSLG